LTHLVSIWQPKVILIPVTKVMPDSWGPSSKNISDIRNYNFYPSTAEVGSDDEWQDDEGDDNEDNELLAAIEELNIAGGYFDTEEINNSVLDI
jgi:hypothetical protein